MHLVNEAWRQNRRFCVRCHSSKIYRLADKRYRCARCGYTFHDFTKRWVGELNLTARQWLWIVKLFELEVPSTQLAKEVGISYPTALKAIYLIRRAIAQESGDNFASAAEHDAARLEPESWHGTEGHGRAFGLRERDGKIVITLSDDLSVEAVLRRQPKFVRQGSILITGRFDEYDGVVLWRSRLPASAMKRLAIGKPPLDGLDSFWNFVRPRLSKFHGTSDHDLYYFLKELAFRYEHRDQEIFGLLVGFMTQLMPDY